MKEKKKNNKNNNTIEELYENMEEKITDEIAEDEELKILWSELSNIEEEMEDTLDKMSKEKFDEYIQKELQLIDCERKKSFSYGYNLSNKLMIDSIRE